MKKEEITLSPYKGVWVEFFPSKGFVTLHDQKALGAFFPSQRLKTYRKPFPSKDSALSFIRLFCKKLDKCYTCLISTDKQYSMAKESENYAIPYTQKQREEKYMINSDPVATIVADINDNGGFDNFNNWNKIEIATYIKSNYYCTKVVAAKVAAIIIHGYYHV